MKKTIHKSILLIILIILSARCVVYFEKNKSSEAIKIDNTEYCK